MNSFARAFMSVLLLAAAGLGAGCSSGGGLVTGSTTAAADAPGTGNNSEKKFNPKKVFEEATENGSQ